MAQCKISYYPLHLGVFFRDNTVRLWNVNEIRMDLNAHKCELWNEVYKHSRRRTVTDLLVGVLLETTKTDFIIG